MTPSRIELSCVLWTLFTVTNINAKTWSFAVSGNRRPYNFIDNDGYLKGSDLDLINEVCKIAGEKCVITVQPTSACTRTVNGRVFPGEGLMDEWFDGCMAFVGSPERENSVEFTDPFRIQKPSFAVQLGNPKGFNPEDISNAVITYLDGAYTNEECLKRLNIGTPKRIIVADGISEGRALMLNGTADALFSPRTTFKRLDVLDKKYRCDSRGTGVMIKKGSELASWWNPAFKVFYESGRYTKHCQTINQKYGGIGDPTKTCLPPVTTRKARASTDPKSSTSQPCLSFAVALTSILLILNEHLRFLVRRDI